MENLSDEIKNKTIFWKIEHQLIILRNQLRNYIEINMNVFNELAELALASRLRRLSDVFMRDVTQVYRNYGLDFEPKWFPLFYLLTQKSPVGIMEAAEALDISHPALIQLAKELEKAGYVQSAKDETDSRKRRLVLSQKGQDLLPELQRLWKAFSDTNLQLLKNQRNNLLFALEEMEQLIAEKSHLARVSETLKIQQRDEVQVVAYESLYAADFKRLNVAWIERYFRVEAEDLAQLSDPEKYILAAGGQVYLALLNRQPVGTCGIIKESDEIYELIKMAVDERFQGKQIGLKLCQHAIDAARALGGKQMWLESNTRLTPAITLYKKVGFYQVEMTPSVFERANIRMQIDL